MKLILSLDPSGSFNYGSGITGFSIFENKNLKSTGNIKAKDFITKENYLEAHLKLIEKENPSTIIIESFVLYQEAAASFFNKELETSELIGAIVGYAKTKNINVVKQRALDIKGALTKPHVLLEIIDSNDLIYKTTATDRQQWYFKGTRISNHIVDSIRHAAYYFVKQGGNKN